MIVSHLHSILPENICQMRSLPLLPFHTNHEADVIPDRDAHWLQTGLDWELMEALAARHRTESEMRAMIESVGLKVVEIFKHPLSLDSLIEVELA